MDPSRRTNFDAYVQARYPALRRYAFLLCGDWSTADDLVQSALIRCERRWGSIEAADPHVYVRRAVHRTACTWRMRRRIEAPLAEATAVLAPDDIGGRDLRLSMLAALRTLPLAQREVIVLRYYEGLTEAETAGELGVAVGTVKSRAARGLAALRHVIPDVSDSDLTPEDVP